MLDLDWPNKDADRTSENANFLIQQLQNYIKFQKVCYGINSGCIPNTKTGYYKTLLGNDSVYAYWTDRSTYGGSDIAKAVLQNGMMIAVHDVNIHVPSNYVFGWVRVDINGAKGPNRVGYDVFYFTFGTNGFFKYGSRDTCTLTSQGTISAKGCSDWILLHGNLDYQKQEVSW